MPRYYFHSHRRQTVLNNHKGIDLSGNAAAREDALTLARDLKHGAVTPGWNWTGWFVVIVDQHGHKVDEVPIADVWAKPLGRNTVQQDKRTPVATVLEADMRLCCECPAFRGKADRF